MVLDRGLFGQNAKQDFRGMVASKMFQDLTGENLNTGQKIQPINAISPTEPIAPTREFPSEQFASEKSSPADGGVQSQRAGAFSTGDSPMNPAIGNAMNNIATPVNEMGAMFPKRKTMNNMGNMFSKDVFSA